ncbi:hypothetical protein M747DRAFT_12450 [Aspergillus niger ATCC 13496]|uniref:Uncharacterized protein n=1 Tax=Aspergillus niger ATCC 13496 TaxID=1353008 RepID=A0A370C2X4_ASPNG|nr:hypothetical protein M747DRAFT_12450 [Aspergillus niger ATCC 13496]
MDNQRPSFSADLPLPPPSSPFPISRRHSSLSTFIPLLLSPAMASLSSRPPPAVTLPLSFCSFFSQTFVSATV